MLNLFDMYIALNHTYDFRETLGSSALHRLPHLSRSKIDSSEANAN